MEATRRLVEGNVAFLLQGLELIQSMTDEQFSAAPPLFPRGGVGAHFRHILDHYDCFFAGCDDGRIDYDRRERDPALETVRAVAARKIRDVCRRLDEMAGDDPRKPLEATLLCGEPGCAEPMWSATSIARELQFLVSHTVHHYAVIAAILRPQGVEPGADFGVAPSTLVYEQGTAGCAP